MAVIFIKKKNMNIQSIVESGENVTISCTPKEIKKFVLSILEGAKEIQNEAKGKKVFTQREAAATNTGIVDSIPKIVKKHKKLKDINKVLLYFQYNIGTSLDCAFSTGILRNSICYYIDNLTKIGLLKIIYKDKDRTTHHMASHYSADSSKWKKLSHKELDLFSSMEGLNIEKIVWTTCKHNE